MKKSLNIGIISTYDELCANASYTKILEQEFRRLGHNVKIFECPTSVFHFNTPELVARQNAIIKNICSEIKKMDYISIQLEMGIYGATLKDINKNLAALISSCKNNSFSVTFHRVDLMSSEQQKIIAKKCRFKKKYLFFAQIYENILALIEKKQGLVITHTNRDEEKIRGKFPNIRTKSHPLSYYSQESVIKLKEAFNKETVKQKYGISNNIKAIGVIGFLTNPCRDVTLVIKSLKLLPDDYCLFIIGGQHPCTYKDFPDGLDVTRNYIKLIEELNLQNRVFFLGAQATEMDMLEAIMFLDYVVLPYVEKGESAPASFYTSISFHKNIFATRNYCFDEIKKFAGEAFFSFDMGNYMELALKLKTLPNKETIYQNRANFLNKYSPQYIANLYLSLFE